MPPIDRTGFFRGIIKDFGVTVTRQKELPQLTVTVMATELYDEATEEWEDWSECQQVITGYFVLATVDENGIPVKCLNYDQVMLAVGWDGETYSGLAAMDLKELPIQFRVIEDTYDGNVKLKMNWIDAVDAEIGLRKLSGKALTDLDTKFPIGTPKKTAAKPKSAKKTAPAPAAKKTPPKPPKASKKAEPEVEEPTLEPCTEDEAYNFCLEANAKLEKPVPDKILDDYWVSHVTEIAADFDNVTDEEYAKIRVAVMCDLNIPF